VTVSFGVEVMLLMSKTLPSAKSSSDPAERDRIRRLVSERGLCGLANDTKWDEFIGAMRARTDWRPSYRFKCIGGIPSRWDVEWFYHLPLPMIAVEWFDVGYQQELREHRQPPRVQMIDYSPWLEELLRRVGLDFRKGSSFIRIFGYSPRSLELFDE
jgi:hypothetical protein